MKFIADLHIHSHFSIATSSQLTPEHLDLWGRIKGLKVVATGDFTHPAWLSELKDKLQPAEQGLFRLRSGLSIHPDWIGPVDDSNAPRFLLSAEISTIYKKEGKVRKVHHVILAPDFDTAEKIQNGLSRLKFNITSDGRPILGMDSRDLLELCLSASKSIVFIPAHIWTPWFSAMGEKSGFDSIGECYGDLAHCIHAVETGLSSDPDMNALCSSLDQYTLVSNSDAHSPEKLGREANRFDTDLSYNGIAGALESSDPARFTGTIEFFPQEGKYHYDGHRKCGVSWRPEETMRRQGVCPVCGKRVTVGVLHRVMQLADRPDASARPRPSRFLSAVPLKEILAEIHQSGAQSKTVGAAYAALIRSVGPELHVLIDAPLDRIRKTGGELAEEAVRRMRSGEVRIRAGYDGEYGVIRMFDEGEIRTRNQESLFGSGATPRSSSGKRKQKDCVNPPEYAGSVRVGADPESGKGRTLVHDPVQDRAIRHGGGPALVLAGPGTGKTSVLVSRILHLIRDGFSQPGNILALTFTNKAADEIRSRIRPLVAAAGEVPDIATFHGLGFSILREHGGRLGRSWPWMVVDGEDRKIILESSIPDSHRMHGLQGRLSGLKQKLRPDDSAADSADYSILADYESRLKDLNAFDLDDLIVKPIEIFRRHPDILAEYRNRFRHILVDEFQDVNAAQAELLRLLMPGEDADLFVIGDPNQSIYGFRGSDPGFILRFQEDYPKAKIYRLTRSYRCPAAFLKASGMVIRKQDRHAAELAGPDSGARIRISKQASEAAEAEFVVRTIERLMGGVRFFSMDSDIAAGNEEDGFGLADFAVLARTRSQFAALLKGFADHGIPCQTSDEHPFTESPLVRAVMDVIRTALHPGMRAFLGPALREYGIPDARMEEMQILLDSEDLKRGLGLILKDLPESLLAGRETEIKRMEILASGSGGDILSFMKSVSLGSPMDTFQPGIEAVSLMTLHASKGLEFPCVFIVGCEQGLIPFSRAGRQTDEDEERRLLYVGMTRAKKRLVLTHAEKRTFRGERQRAARSPFLDEIGEDLIEREKEHSLRRKRKNDDQLGLF
ncbi:UvrD-helicase domain-containing protein [bacterium]|nr:UvrD-helicase domain-containing protein [bacterium]